MPQSSAFTRFAISLLVSMPLLAGAATMECTAKVSGKLNDSQMKKMAKIDLSTAQATAVDLVGKANLDSVVSKELEVEGGCLVYSFDLRLRASDGIEEVQIDAASGKVVSRKHETAADEAKENLADAKPAHAKKK